MRVAWNIGGRRMWQRAWTTRTSNWQACGPTWRIQQNRQCFRQASVRKIMSIGLMGQKYCEDYSTLGNCKSRKPEEYVSPPKHTHKHTPSHKALFSFLTVCNNMKQHAPQHFGFQIHRPYLNPKHVAYELRHCVKTLILYARPSFFLRICA